MKSNLTERAQAAAEIVRGTVEEKVGHLIGNDVLETKGAAHVAEGQARDKLAKTAETVKGVVEEVVGSAKEAVGGLVGDNSTKLNGKVEKAKGKVRQALNK